MTDTTISALKTTLIRVPWAGEPPLNGIMPPEAPGHGLAFKPEVLRSHRVGGFEART
jgi:hypothetical protein